MSIIARIYPVYLFLKIPRVFEDPKLKFFLKVRTDDTNSIYTSFSPMTDTILIFNLFFGIFISHDMGHFGLNSH